MRITTILPGLFALALVLPACGDAPAPARPAAKPEVKQVTLDSKALEAATSPPKAEPPPPEKPPEPAVDPNAEKIKAAVTVAREISADPEHADDVLARHGLDRRKLDAMMFEIAADPALTDAYMAARRAS